MQVIDQYKLKPYYDKESEVKYIVWNQDQWVSYVSSVTNYNLQLRSRIHVLMPLYHVYRTMRIPSKQRLNLPMIWGWVGC